MADPQSAESRVGTVLRGKWRLERLLGVGGMAAVYEATHRIGRRDAIKILHATVARSPDLRARFEQEAHAVNRFTHPGAVEIRDVDTTEDGAPFLVMELLEGAPLSQHVGREGGLTLDDLLRYCEELLDVLVAAHAQGIIHRDIKPDNLFVLNDGRLKVLDFGIARMRESSAKSSQTLLGTRLGTLPYMPPEQIKGLPIDARADLFAVGAMLFRLITGRRVHEAPTEAELATRMLTEQAPPLGSAAPATPAPVCMVVDRALAFDRQQRYPDAQSMQQDVRAARAGSTPSVAARMLAELGPPSVPAAGAGAPRIVTAVVTPSSVLADAPTDVASPAAARAIEATGATVVPVAPPAAAPALPGAVEPTSATRAPRAPGTVGQGPVGLPYLATALAPTSSDLPTDMPTAAASPSAIAVTHPAQQVTMVSPGAPALAVEGVAPPAVAIVDAPASQAPVAIVAEPHPPTMARKQAADDEQRKRVLAIVLSAAGLGLVVLLLVGWWWAASRVTGDDGVGGGAAASENADAAADAGALEPGPGSVPEAAGTERAPASTRATSSTRQPAVPSTTVSPTSKSAQAGTSPTAGTAPISTPTATKTNDPKKDKDKDKDKNKGKGKGQHGHDGDQD